MDPETEAYLADRKRRHPHETDLILPGNEYAVDVPKLLADHRRGQRAIDAMMLLGVKLGINPVPMDPEEFVDAVMKKFTMTYVEALEMGGIIKG